MDMALTLKALAAFAFVLSLMYLLSLALRRFGLPGQGMMPGARRRLKVVEYLPLDAKRRLVLIRRDQKEHLLVLGANGETVVETNIPAAPDNIIDLSVQKEQKNA